MEELIRVTPDRERAKSILKMTEIILERIRETNKKKYPSLVLVDYYEIIKQLLTAIALLDGYKALSHKALIEYSKKYLFPWEYELVDKIRRIRNRINYEGYFLDYDFLERNEVKIIELVDKLRRVLTEKLEK